MTTSDVLNILRAYILANISPVIPVYKQEHTPVTAGKATGEFIAVNILRKTAGDWELAAGNVNWHVPDINVDDFPEANLKRLGEVENQLRALFIKGVLLTHNGEQAYFTVQSTETMKDEYSHFVNMKLKSQITNN